MNQPLVRALQKCSLNREVHACKRCIHGFIVSHTHTGICPEGCWCIIEVVICLVWWLGLTTLNKSQQAYMCTKKTNTDLLLRKREDPEHLSFPSAMMAILSPRRSASSMKCVVRSTVLSCLCLASRSQVALRA